MTKQQTPRRPAATGLLFGLAGLALSPLVVVGLVLSAVGLARATKGIVGDARLSMASVALSLLGLAFSTAWAVGFGTAVDEPVPVVQVSYVRTVDTVTSTGR
ncbi:hypothetical protein AB5J62_36625 [Amycolatopsis sp. cg5]|uniref:hypothetical protein n=1 Tax=Amycolatopsis sp. cg5 TaxID=3238802 RepID=UPI003523DDC9